jgi:hypothetical protein
MFLARLPARGVAVAAQCALRIAAPQPLPRALHASPAALLSRRAGTVRTRAPRALSCYARAACAQLLLRARARACVHSLFKRPRVAQTRA